MSILTEIISWSSEIPGWQGDAVRRILEKGLLEEADKKEIVAMFKKEFGLIEDKDVNIPSPNLLKLREEKELSDEKVLVTLKSMGHLQNVNALDSDQKLEFGDTGVTVVFGENASGKSGYARVLKKACRARGYVDNILPNVYQDSSKEETASAIFNLSINGENKEIKWSDKDENPDDMTYIAVFDSKSERFYVDDKNTITYIPYGLDVFDKLAYLCDYLRDKLQDDLVEVDEFPEELENIPKNSKVRLLLDSLDRDTETNKINNLAKLSENEKSEQQNLKTMVRNLDKIDESITMSKRLKTRIEKVKMILSKFDTQLAEDNYEKLKKSFETVLSLEKSSEEISKTQFQDEPLAGIGSDPWRALYLAAEKYSTEVAYPGKEFPNIESESVCVLCQQPIEEGARIRFGKFKNFVVSEIQNNLNAAITKRKKYVAGFEDLDYTFALIDSDMLDEIGEINNSTKVAIEKYIQSTQPNESIIQENIENDKWKKKPNFLSSPQDLLVKMEEDLQAEINKKVILKDPTKAVDLKNKLSDLEERELLSKNKKAVIQILDQIKLNASLNDCIKKISTRGISEKSKALMQEYVTDSLKSRLNDEMKHIGASQIPLLLEQSVKKGETSHTLKLDSGSFSQEKVSNVLSEGEQRAVSIASFLAEINQFGHTSGIIFDDPVSSLDHKWRKKVAKRLINEGTKRQVIIFTHDIVFLRDLQNYAEKEGQKLQPTYLKSREDRIGIVSDTGPSSTQNVNAKVNQAKKHLAEANKAHSDNDDIGYMNNLNLANSTLRKAWERLVESKLFNGVVERFQNEVKTLKLKEVRITEDDWKLIDNEMSELSSKEHDESEAEMRSDLTFDTIKERIEIIEKYIVELKERKKEINKKHKE